MIDRYHHYLSITGHPTAAAVLAVGESLLQVQPRENLTPKQAAAMLGVSTTTIYDLCRNGRLRHQKIGRAIRIQPNDLADYNDDSTESIHSYRCLKKSA